MLTGKVLRECILIGGFCLKASNRLQQAVALSVETKLNSVVESAKEAFSIRRAVSHVYPEPASTEAAFVEQG